MEDPKKIFIPVNGLSKEEAEETISQMISDYSVEINFDETLGTIEINGDKKIPYTKQIWMPSPETEPIKNEENKNEDEE